MTDLAVVLPLAGVVALAFTVESALGFGATVVAMALGAFFIPVRELLPSFVPLNMVLSASIVVQDRKHVDGRVLARTALCMAAGLPVGFLAARAVDAHDLARAFGVLVVALAIVELARARTRRPPTLASPGAAVEAAVDAPETRAPSKPALDAILVAAGVVHGAFGTGGPLAVYALGNRLTDKSAFRATLAALWLSLNVLLVGAFVVDDRVSLATGRASLCLAPAVVIGLVAGTALHRRVPAAAFRVVVWCALAVVGAALVLR